MIVADTIRAARKSRSMTQERLAALCGWARTYQVRLETGRVAEPRTDTIRTIAKSLGMSVPDFWSYQAKPGMSETDHGRLLSAEIDLSDACQLAQKLVDEIEHAQKMLPLSGSEKNNDPWDLIEHLREKLVAIATLNGGYI